MPRGDGGPAFPTDPQAPSGNEGMTLRDWFAGQYIAGLATRGIIDAYSAARNAYELADAALIVRKASNGHAE